LGNNDGLNLSETPQFKSKEITKRSVIDDVISSNSVLYAPKEKIDHVVVIKYVPYVGDSKRAIDEYVSEIFMGGQNILSIYNVCEDSLLAAPIMIDLALLTELFERIEWNTDGKEEYQPFGSILSVLGYLLKAPLYPSDQKVVNALFKQRSSLENILKAVIGLPTESNMDLELKVKI
jgi:myo-inositol-1-phosphate synthase